MRRLLLVNQRRAKVYNYNGGKPCLYDFTREGWEEACDHQEQLLDMVRGTSDEDDCQLVSVKVDTRDIFPNNEVGLRAWSIINFGIEDPF